MLREEPCRRCQSAGVKCEYKRKRKRINVYDTEIEDYQDRIKELEERVRELEKKRKVEVEVEVEEEVDTPPIYPRSLTTAQKAESAAPVAPITLISPPAAVPALDAVDLSVYLGSGSSELVCWNLKRFLAARGLNTSASIIISPDFNSFIEESVYDYLLGDRKVPDLKPLESLTIEKVEFLLRNVVSFISSGFLTLDPNSFRKNLRWVFNTGGRLKLDILLGDADGVVKMDFLYYFVIKIVLICALGEVYSSEYSLQRRDNSNGTGRSQTNAAGLAYFEIIIHFLPSISFFRKENIETNLEVIELFGLIAIYLRILDKKNLALLVSINALYMCMSLNLHKRSPKISQQETRIFWSTYCLNRFLSLRIGKSLLLREGEITISLPEIDANTNACPSSEDFSNAGLLVHYVYLAQIAEQITNEIYCFSPPPQRFMESHSKIYLNSVLTIVHNLVDWVNNLPPSLTLKLPLESGNPSNRLIYTLHLNYLHHIYLACIPILLNLVKLKAAVLISSPGAITANSHGSSFSISELPKNIRNIITICIQSSQLTINLFIALYKENLLRVFGFTDLDYLFSSTLVLIICILLKLPKIKENYSLEEYLQVSINLMGEMKNKGNLVAGGKLHQILDLILGLEIEVFQMMSDHIRINYYFTELSDNASALNPLLLRPDSQPVQPPTPVSAPIPPVFTPVVSLGTTPNPNLLQDFHDFASLTEPLNNGNWSGNNLNITEEDMMFMNEIIQDYQP